MMPKNFAPRWSSTHPRTVSPVRAHSTSDTYAKVTPVRNIRLQQKEKREHFPLMHSPKVRKWQSCQNQGLPSLDTSDFACNTKSMSILDNLIEAARTTLVPAGGLDKLERPTTRVPIKVITINIRQHLSMLGAQQTDNPLTCQGYYARHEISPSTLDNLFRS